MSSRCASCFVALCCLSGGVLATLSVSRAGFLAGQGVKTERRQLQEEIGSVVLEREEAADVQSGHFLLDETEGDGNGDTHVIMPPGSPVCSLEELTGVKRVVGDLILSGDCGWYEFLDVSPLAQLETVEGSVQIEGTRVGNPFNVSFPVLREVSGNVTIQGNSQLALLSFPALTSVGGGVSVGGHLFVRKNFLLRSATFSALSAVGEGLEITDNAWLKSLSMPTLRSVGKDLEIAHNGLESLSVGALASVGGDFKMTHNTFLMSTSIGALESVGKNLDITHNTFLKNLTANALISVGESLTVRTHKLLETLSLLQLQAVGADLTVVDNPFLSTLVIASSEGHGQGCDSTDPLPLTVQGAVDVQAVGDTGSVDSVSQLLEAYCGSAELQA